MRKPLFFMVSVVVLVLFGCTKDIEMTAHQPLVSQDAKVRFLSLDSIQTLATELPAVFSDDPLTRSSYTGMVADLLPLNDFLNVGVTKSEDNDGEATENIYIVNYADDGGFAVLSADTRMETILAYSDQGNISDTMNNPGVKMFLEMIPAYAASRMIEDTSLSIEDRYPPQTALFLRKEYDGDGPFVPVRWGQRSPFNDGLPFKDNVLTKCSDSPNGNPPAGCVSIALLQIMAANSHPFQFHSGNGWYTCYWDTWRKYVLGALIPKGSYDHKAIGALVYEIGNAVDMDYGCSSSSSTIKKANDALRNTFGYATDGVYSYHIDRVMADLNNQRSIYVSGFATKNRIGHSDGHAWVIDGYKNVYNVYALYDNFYDENYNLIRQEYVGELKRKETRWLHCNYGWYGAGNGYYYTGVFNTEFPQEQDPGTQKPDKFYHYRFKLELIKNIRRK